MAHRQTNRSDSSGGKPSSSNAGSTSGKKGVPVGQPVVAEQVLLAEQRQAEDQKDSQDNFFDFRDNSETDIWGPAFTSTLRKSSEHFEAMPYIPDNTVERIGGAFVDEERSLNPFFRRNALVMDTDSPSPTDHSLSVLSSDADFERVRQLEKKIQELELARWKPPSIPETINRLLLGKSCLLSWYKSIKEKKELLDLAILTLDGNCIMAVILFIKKTVDQSILFNILEHYPVAARHYAIFLKKLKNWKELKTLYRRLSNYDDLGYFSLQECDAPGLDKEEHIRRIKLCHMQFKNLTLEHQEDLQHVEEYSRLINKQQKIEEADGHGKAVVVRENGVLFKPLTTTLLYCCLHHKGKERNTGNPEELRKLFNIPERQYFQMELLSLALRRDWSGLNSMVTSKGVLGFGKKRKSPIGFERVVRLLGQERYRAPESVLVQYLDEVEDLEVRYQLSMEVDLYEPALECLKSLKDRERVRAFINCVPPNKHYEYRAKIDSLLSNSQIKWKY